MSFHSVGRDYRGVVGAVMAFYRRPASDEATHPPTDVVVVGGEAVQISYMESAAAVEARFNRWLERGLVEALDCWPRGEQ